MSSPEELQKKIAASIDEVAALMGTVELRGAQSARVKLELRTFSTGGTGVKDINGNPLTPYSEAYKKKRAREGLQTNSKDLIYSKNTSIIKDSITVGLSAGKPALGFTRAEGAEIAGYQEEQNKTKIFQVASGELTDIKTEIKNLVMAKLREITKNWE